MTSQTKKSTNFSNNILTADKIEKIKEIKRKAINEAVKLAVVPLLSKIEGLEYQLSETEKLADALIIQNEKENNTKLIIGIGGFALGGLTVFGIIKIIELFGGK